MIWETSDRKVKFCKGFPLSNEIVSLVIFSLQWNSLTFFWRSEKIHVCMLKIYPFYHYGVHEQYSLQMHARAGHYLKIFDSMFVKRRGKGSFITQYASAARSAFGASVKFKNQSSCFIENRFSSLKILKFTLKLVLPMSA